MGCPAHANRVVHLHVPLGKCGWRLFDDTDNKKSTAFLKTTKSTLPPGVDSGEAKSFITVQQPTTENKTVAKTYLESIVTHLGSHESRGFVYCFVG